LKLQKANNFQNGGKCRAVAWEKGALICGAGVLTYSILEEDDFGSAIWRWSASRYELWFFQLLKSGIEYSRISRAESGLVRRSTPSRAGFRSAGRPGTKPVGGWFRAAG
jgi:hypothetical protein